MYLADLVGKTGRVLARDLTEDKVRRIRENAVRCGMDNLTAEVRDACVSDPELEKKADTVLADVPCSGYGVIGRKPDIKYQASREKEASLIELQRRILDRASACVKPGGVLIYSTCTVSQKENQENVRWFLEEHPFVPRVWIRIFARNCGERIPPGDGSSFFRGYIAAMDFLSPASEEKSKRTDGDRA